MWDPEQTFAKAKRRRDTCRNHSSSITVRTCPHGGREISSDWIYPVKLSSHPMTRRHATTQDRVGNPEDLFPFEKLIGRTLIGIPMADVWVIAAEPFSYVKCPWPPDPRQHHTGLYQLWHLLTQHIILRPLHLPSVCEPQDDLWYPTEERINLANNMQLFKVTVHWLPHAGSQSVNLISAPRNSAPGERSLKDPEAIPNSLSCPGSPMMLLTAFSNRLSEF